MMNTNCPHCGSSQTLSRDVAYKAGTSETKSSGGFAGIGFGRRRGSSVWFGRSSRFSTHQTLFAQAAQPVPILAPLSLIILAFFVGGEMLGFFLIAGWLLLAIRANWNFEDEWICKKCGTKFIPSLPATTSVTMNINQPVLSTEVSVSETAKDAAHGNTGDGKSCSICGQWFPTAEFDYGNKDNRSYCRSCSQGEKRAYAQGGVEAAREFRSGKRATWIKS